ncbi:DUF6227 family protein [Streptomyces sp. NBC_01387]|uniref:DUF6227 family protein n=1 Tax=unclassified Streptomyces TaxID=2593676 RepID=UPI0020250559|nr:MULTISPECIES: DUF6227 family protein [unclassified Streptomyces]MCX4550347.1 DUF6227 family protein [Streptomyces sp. NBC_01500]WSC21838.1 DUF6227 family protein [Streptomyces sp. NBC_01766]WSV55793.1 DUF6227 family protein [Streptomyces sp. NBC_01014]
MSDPHETTEEHLARLLGRALNSFELPDATIERLDCALAHNSALHSSHHSSGAGLHRETYRHTFLIADGSDLTLWELVYDTGAGAGPQHELYTGQEEARLAVTRIRGADAAAMFPDEDPEDDLGILSALKSTPPAPVARTYSADRSADHARRVLRRAENPDRPGEDVARLLRSAFAHQISQAFGTQCRFETGEDAGFTLYEHAFLLLDGQEFSLWEVEHTATPDGRHMCEVYTSQSAARTAMELRARVR